MQSDHILAFNAALLIALISPGPAFLLVLRTGVSCGKSAGLALGAGQGVAAAFWTLAALAGLEGVFHLFPWAYSAVKIVGALYLMYLAWRLWKQAADPVLPFFRPPPRYRPPRYCPANIAHRRGHRGFQAHLVADGVTVAFCARRFDQPDQSKIGYVRRGCADCGLSAQSGIGRKSIYRWQSSGA